MSEFLDYDSWLGLVVDDVGSDSVVGHLDVRDTHKQPYGIVHGGVYCALVESLASIGAATWAMEQGLVGAVGVHNATDFLRSTRGGRIVGRATPVHQGRSQQLWEVALTGDDRLLATGRVRMHNLVEDQAIGGITRRRPSEA